VRQPNAETAPASPGPLAIDEQVAILLRGVDYGDAQTLEVMAGELRQRLAAAQAAGRPLLAYLGVDPTGSLLTLGHAVALRKLRQLQALGHRAVFLIGDMTALIGDPSDKTAARRRLTPAEVDENARTYVEQAMRLLDPSRTEIRRNSEWLARLTFADVIELASNFTVQQFLQRDNFARRFQRGDAIWLHEFYYALMQAYDAAAMGVDIQVGGTEQLFNLMAGRKLQEAMGQAPLIPLTMPILVGTDGRERMSKTTGNYVAIVDAPEQQYGQTMSLPDEAMANWFQLLTDLPQPEIDHLLAEVAAGRLHPMAAKKRLAQEIVTVFHDPAAAAAAAEHFARTVQAGELPSDIPQQTLTAPVGLLDLLASAGLTTSKGDGRRLVQQGGVRLDGVVVTDPLLVLEPGTPHVLQAGKRRYLRLV
jgi:tyrosyl-tRNA synthetase